MNAAAARIVTFGIYHRELNFHKACVSESHIKKERREVKNFKSPKPKYIYVYICAILIATVQKLVVRSPSPCLSLRVGQIM